ncbi:hypothetical protein BGZ83_002795, partial [Gryganskiella cystojenkinii]
TVLNSGSKQWERGADMSKNRLEHWLLTHAHAPMLELIEDVIPAEVRISDTEAGSVSALYAMSHAMDKISKIESLRFDDLCTLDLVGLDSLFM